MKLISNENCQKEKKKGKIENQDSGWFPTSYMSKFNSQMRSKNFLPPTEHSSAKKKKKALQIYKTTCGMAH